MRLPDAGQRGFAFTAAGHGAGLNGELTPELYAALRAEGPIRPRREGHRGHADTLAFVPFRKLPPWFKWRWVCAAVRDKQLVQSAYPVVAHQ